MRTHTQSWEQTGSHLSRIKHTYHLGGGEKKNLLQIVLIIKKFDVVPYVQQQKDLSYLNPPFGLVWLVSMNQAVICNSGCWSEDFF